MSEVKFLDLGCGNKKAPGSIGLDINADTDADVVHDLNQFPYPFEDNTFDKVVCDNVIEHLDDVFKVMEELNRICKNGAEVKIIVPYFRSHWAFIDPTHKHYFTYDSFTYFDPNHIHNKLYNYSPVKFEIQKTIFNENINRSWLFGLVKKIAHWKPHRYEKWLSTILPMDDITYYLKVIK